MGYQKCPVCDGVGYDPMGLMGYEACPTCKGARIINEFNGKPPFVETGKEDVEIPYVSDKDRAIISKVDPPVFPNDRVENELTIEWDTDTLNYVGLVILIGLAVYGLLHLILPLWIM